MNHIGPVVICIPRYGDLRNLHAMEHSIARLSKPSPAASEAAYCYTMWEETSPVRFDCWMHS